MGPAAPFERTVGVEDASGVYRARAGARPRGEGGASPPTARGVELPSLLGQSDRPMRALDERQLCAVAEAAGAPPLSVNVLGWCGLRFGELAGLRVRHFDVLRRELRVETALSEIGGRLVEASPKTRASVRNVPVPAWLVDELAPLLEHKGPNDYLLTSGGQPAPHRQLAPARLRSRARGRRARPRRWPRGDPAARPAAHLRLAPHQSGDPGEGAVGDARPRLGVDHAGPVRAPPPGRRSPVR